MKLGVAGGQYDLEVRDGIIPHADVVGDGVLEQGDVLVHHGQGTGEHRAGDLADGLAVKQNLAAPGDVEPGDELGQGGFAAAAGAHDGHPAAGL